MFMQNSLNLIFQFQPMAAVNAKVDSKAPAPAKPQKKFLSQLDEFF
jgi:hypothetical protein